MKKFKKIMAVLVAAMMIMATMVPAWAAPSSGTDTAFTITIDNAVAGEKYSAYKVFDVTYDVANSSYVTPAAQDDVPGSADTTSQHMAYAYTIDSSTNQFWGDLSGMTGASKEGTEGTAGYTITLPSDYGLKFVLTTTPNVYNVLPSSGTKPTDEQVRKLAEFLSTKLTGKNADAGPTAATATTNNHTDYSTGELSLTLTTPGPGYYFVSTTTGALCSLDTTEYNAIVRDKNSIPSVTKQVSKTDGSGYSDNAVADIGDTVYYKIEVTDGVGTNKSIVVHDVMSKGLTLDISSFTVTDDDNGTNPSDVSYSVIYKNDTTNVPVTGEATSNVHKADGSTYALGDATCSFEITFAQTYIEKLASNKKITITYSARLNKDATIADGGNSNKAKLAYSNQMSQYKETKVYTYAAALYKYATNGRELADAQFTLLRSGDNTVMYFDVVNEGSSTTPAHYRYNSTYTVANVSNTAPKVTDTLITPGSGAVIITGLETGTYRLTETKAPDGYRKLEAVQTLTVAETNVVLPNDVSMTSSDASVQNIKFEKNVDDTSDGTQYQIATTSVLGIENTTGPELPSTGGMGTTVLYIVGGMLVILAGAYLFFSRKKTA